MSKKRPQSTPNTQQNTQSTQQNSQNVQESAAVTAPNVRVGESVFANWNVPYIIYSALLFIAFLFVYQYIYDSKIHLGGDNAEYYSLARGLYEGKGFAQISDMNAASHKHWPPGYPFILSILMRIVGTETGVLTAMNGLFLLGSLYFLFDLFRRFSGNIHLAFAVCIACLFNYHIMAYATIMMSEIPFLFFATLSIWSFVQLDLTKHPFIQRFFYPFIFALAFAFYIRTAGLSLVAGFLLYLLLNRNWAFLAATAIGFVVLVLPWQIRNANVAGASYLDELMLINPTQPDLGKAGLGDFFTRLLHNSQRYFAREIPSGCFPWLENNDPSSPISATEYLIGLPILVLSAFGLYRTRRHRLLLVGYTLGSFGILLLWPDVWFGVRFVLPFLPFILYFFANGLYELILLIVAKIGVQGTFVTTAVLPFALLVFLPKWYYKEEINTKNPQQSFMEYKPCLWSLNYGAQQPYEDKYKNYFEIATWCKANTPKDAIVCCRKPGLFYLFADRHVIQVPRMSEADMKLPEAERFEKYMTILRNRKVTHVVLDQLGFTDVSKYLLPVLQANPQRFTIVQQVKSPDTYCIQFNPNAPAGK